MSIQRWKRWWNSLEGTRKWLPLQILLSYWVVLYLLKGLGSPGSFLAAFPVILYYLGPAAAGLFRFSLPFFLACVLYDGQRFVTDLWRGEIHVSEIYLLEKQLFGLGTGVSRLTLNEWWQTRTHPVLDFFTGFSYIAYLPIFLLCTGYFFFVLPRRQQSARARFYVHAQAPQMMWAFLAANVLALFTYFLYPASPPWYVEAHGLGPVDLSVGANAAGCARFDDLLGISLFKSWYGNSPNAHGALPSMHVAYPFIAMLYAWKFGSLRLVTTSVYALVAFAAVYLNHHYLIDVLLGSGYAALSVLTVDTLWSLSLRTREIVFVDRMRVRLKTA